MNSNNSKLGFLDAHNNKIKSSTGSDKPLNTAYIYVGE